MNKYQRKKKISLICFTSQVMPRDNLHYYGNDVFETLKVFLLLKGGKRVVFASVPEFYRNEIDKV